MSSKGFHFDWILQIVVLGALVLFAPQARAQTTPEPIPVEQVNANSTNPPWYIEDLVDSTDLTPEQMEQMRAAGAGWGNIRIATELAEKISEKGGDDVSFDEALSSVLLARADGRGWGDIAQDHDLVIGPGGEGSMNPPRYIEALVDSTELTPEQMEQMRVAGAGWGNIRIATELAEKISEKGGDDVLFEEALSGVLLDRAEGKGWGDIAQDHDLKIGQFQGNKFQIAEPVPVEGVEARQGLSARETARTQGQKRGFFRKLGGFFGFGRANRPEKAERPAQAANGVRGNGIEKPQRTPKPEKFERPERPPKPEKPVRPERPEKPEKPARPEKPEKPEKPAKPERP